MINFEHPVNLLLELTVLKIQKALYQHGSLMITHHTLPVVSTVNIYKVKQSIVTSIKKLQKELEFKVFCASIHHFNSTDIKFLEVAIVLSMAFFVGDYFEVTIYECLNSYIC